MKTFTQCLNKQTKSTNSFSFPNAITAASFKPLPILTSSPLIKTKEIWDASYLKLKQRLTGKTRYVECSRPHGDFLGRRRKGHCAMVWTQPFYTSLALAQAPFIASKQRSGERNSVKFLDEFLVSELNWWRQLSCVVY